jgi:hypothetical protein
MGTFHRRVKWDSVGAFLLQDRLARYETGAVNYLKVVAPEGEPGVLPGKETYIQATYQRAGDPKELIVLPIKHFDIYQEPWLSRAASDAIARFDKYLVRLPAAAEGRA